MINNTVHKNTGHARRQRTAQTSQIDSCRGRRTAAGTPTEKRRRDTHGEPTRAVTGTRSRNARPMYAVFHKNGRHINRGRTRRHQQRQIIQQLHKGYKAHAESTTMRPVRAESQASSALFRVKER